MESKEILGMMGAYASIYEGCGKGKKGKKKMHDCATHVEHSEYGQGLCIKEQHTMLEDGTVTHYDVKFGRKIVENVPVTELRILASEAHAHEENEVKNAEVLDEAPRGLPYGPVGRGFRTLPAGPKREKMMKNEKKYTKAAMKDADDEGEAVGNNREKMGRISSALRNPRLREETDLFDYLLEYLVAEGYADTNKAALAIMANMSEEWKQSILDEEVPKRIAIEPSSPRLMPNAGPARVHDPKKSKKVVRK